MAKKRTTDVSPQAARRRTARTAVTVPPVDGVLAPESASAAQAPISEAADTAPRGPATLSGTPAEETASDPTYEDIAREAYLRYLGRGGDHGRDFDDWIEAEQDLRSRR